MEGMAIRHNFGRDRPRDHPARFGLIWLSGFRGEDLHNRYKSAERKISHKNPEQMLNYSLPCSCS